MCAVTSPMPEHGAATQVWAAASPELDDVGSVYLADCAIRDDVAPYALDERARRGAVGACRRDLCARRRHRQ